MSNIKRITNVEEIGDLNLIRLGEAFAREAGTPGRFNLNWFKVNWRRFILLGIGAIWVLKSEDGDTIGIIGGILAPDLFDGEIDAMESFWYVEPDHRGIDGILLFREFEIWAKMSKPRRIIMGAMQKSMPDKLAQFYDSRGYKPLEMSFVKELVWQSPLPQ